MLSAWLRRLSISMTRSTCRPHRRAEGETSHQSGRNRATVADHLAEEWAHIKRSLTRCARRAELAGDNFLYGFKGAPAARQRRASARLQRKGASCWPRGKA